MLRARNFDRVAERLLCLCGVEPSWATNSEAFKNRSGGIEGRPTSLYICANSGESSLSATSASC